MYSSKVHSIFQNLEKQSCNICADVDAFMSNILKWADELVGIVEKEFTADKESALFLLPKTPCEKKTRGRKPRNAGISKCSVVNSTLLQNETTNLDDTISLRTRGAKKAATSKISQLNVTKDTYETKQETLIIETNSKEDDVSEATFVMPKANTRTKPVLKNKKPDSTIPGLKSSELEKNETQVLISSNDDPDKELSQKEMSKTGRSPPERPSKCKISRTPNESPVKRLSRQKKSRTLSGSPAERPSARKVFRSLSGSPIVRTNSVLVLKSSSKSPIVRSSTLRSSKNVTLSPVTRFSKTGNNISTSQDLKANVTETRSSLSNRTVTIKKELTPKASSTFFSLDELGSSSNNEEEKTPVVKEDRFFRLSKTSTPALDVEKTSLAKAQNMQSEISEKSSIDIGSSEVVAEDNTNAPVFTDVENVTEEAFEEVEIPKKKRKLKKDEEVKENIQEVGDTMRITRTKSKAIKQMMEENENKQADLSAFAKKLLDRAKMTSIKKNQLAALLESDSSTPKNGPGQLTNNLPFGNLTTSKSKYHLLLSSSKKLKTPLAALPNSAMKIVKTSEDKVRSKNKAVNRDSSVENMIRSVTKPLKDDPQEREIKLRSKKEKEEEAILKRQYVIKSKQEELKRKNEMKHQMAMKQREKLEQEKYHNMIQLEKEKEERHKLILQERQMKLKEEAFKRKMLTQQKIAENVERRRMEEEARLAKLKEMEAEDQRLALEKQKEQERQEKRAQERLAQKKAREEYEMQLKQELEAERLKAEKLLTAKKCAPNTSKLQSASKRQKFGIIGEKREWDYKPRNENDYGLEDEHSEVDSEDEKCYDKAKPALPWAKKVMHGKSPVVKILTLEMLCEFMPCYQKSPDIYKMFKMTPSKRIKRSSSAIWNTPSS